MLVFIDESGDSGFRIEKGSSPVFVVAMVIFENGAAARTTEAAIRALREDLKFRDEFKFNKSSHSVRDKFFDTVQYKPFRVRAVAVRKEHIHSPHLRAVKESFYGFFVRMMMQHDQGALQGADVILDGSGDRAFKREFGTYLKRYLGNRMASFRFGDSKRDNLVQLSDMCAGAIARSRRGDRSNRDRWRQMLAPRIDDIWDFE